MFADMSDTMKFMLNGAVREVSGLSPNMTILQYLRIQERLTGTKEGCAEGDCGACTVIIGELYNGQIHYQAMNACILLLPTLDGKHLITIEHLKSSAGELHPVQQAMIDCHGSQCGFCTPGFVMSLACLFQDNDNASDQDIQDAIAGNLCRCTGYRPIMNAARTAKNKDSTLKTDGEELKKLQRSEMFVYEADGKKFYAPLTIEELADVIAEYPDATILAGGTDVGLWVTKQHHSLSVLIYTGRVKELLEINETSAGLEIGAAVSYTAAFERLAAYDESLEELLRRFGSVQIRNTGTLGGNIANGSPVGDGMPPLIALGAQLVLRSQTGSRTINLEDYFIAYSQQDRKPGEFIEKIIVPPRPDDLLFKTYKLSKRFDQDISAVCGAFALVLKNGTVSSAKIAFGGMAATPKRATKTEEVLTGKIWNEKTVKQAMAALNEDFSPLTDMRASADYRSMAAQNLLYRFYIETTEPETETRIYDYDDRQKRAS